jgi:hypothetical protein
MILLCNDRHCLWLEYWSTKDYNCKPATDWSILIAKLLSLFLLQDRSSVDAGVKWEDDPE